MILSLSAAKFKHGFTVCVCAGAVNMCLCGQVCTSGSRGPVKGSK